MHLIKGIDVSEFQGIIDFDKVKNDGYDFVIIRAGFGQLESQVDKSFKRNIEAAINSQVDVGAYWFSYATNINEAKTEARLFAKLMEPYKNKVKYPLYYDYEYSSYDYSVSKGVIPTKKLITDMTIAFIEELDRLGWYGGVYTNPDYYYNRYENERLKPYSLWLAQYNSKNDLPCDIWQYSSTGNVDGIYGYTDLNQCFTDLSSKIISLNKNGFNSEVKEEKLLTVTGNGVRLRDKDSIEGKILNAAYIGDKVTFIKDMNNGWSNVVFKNQEGFMSNLYLDDKNLSKYPKAKNNGNYVNFRKEPSLKGEIISQLFEGKTFDVISIADGWIYTEIDGKNGYIFYDKSYIQI